MEKNDAVHPFKYEFFDEQLASTHKGIFDLVTILGFYRISGNPDCLPGILGMATYTAERRTKEVGIRKVWAVMIKALHGCSRRVSKNVDNIHWHRCSIVVISLITSGCKYFPTE